MLKNRRRALALLATALAAPRLHAADGKRPLTIAVSAEYGMLGSHAAQSIEKGVALAVAEINEKGGVLGGRPLQVVRRDDRGVPARAIDNVRELAADPDVIAVFCGRFSPVAEALIPVVSELSMPLLDPWAAADGLANNGQKPNFVFRLALNDSWAIDAMLAHARQRRYKRLTALLPNNAWGRSCQAAIERQIRAKPGLLVDVTWHNWGDANFAPNLIAARENHSDALLLVANEAEGKHILELLSRMPPGEQLPIIAHWGITAGDFHQVTNGLASKLDLVTVQTFAFSDAPDARQRQVLQTGQRILGEDVRQLRALVGFAHAYDLACLLARAIDKAGSADRRAIRNALEQLGPHPGLVRHYLRPFTPANHEALTREQVFIARYDARGNLVRVREH